MSDDILDLIDGAVQAHGDAMRWVPPETQAAWEDDDPPTVAEWHRPRGRGVTLLRRLLSLTLPRLGYGECLRCGLPWWLVAAHEVEYDIGCASFFLCEHCWARSDAPTRVGYALIRIESWPRGRRLLDGDALLQAVEAAS